ncbi:MAG: helix-turn-helix transcriptional regulator [Myxococcales bacterium]|nr:helix-turn-helix transcriptional regulator [Myxococcales bacterium]MBL0197760.1 helix-turn-helix transcriptional regulator [Myxococcales bacterium]HQY60235.1 metalloregulator ArsR/SmtB family transcription factor [Polyangiaceae bacterium]
MATTRTPKKRSPSSPAEPHARARAPASPPGDLCGPEEHARRAGSGRATDEQLERAAALFRAAGEVARLRLLERLADGEWCVTELAEAAGVGLSTVSQQLRILRAERVVTRRRAGKHIFYGLADSHIVSLLRSAIEHAAEPSAHDHDHDE